LALLRNRVEQTAAVAFIRNSASLDFHSA